ncbi:hypothetical protein SAMN05216561_11435 [Nocardioides psychrotolerans]|uniref:Uncharacterized protein n=1 Tax=Nocardioides psychrotolerans TaxID=1005945 RepID=A0A1I3LMY4_9ACTN|nr:hypothetical protein SAMN05216561_11435 [Nocardioides psychrotolerans]
MSTCRPSCNCQCQQQGCGCNERPKPYVPNRPTKDTR